MSSTETSGSSPSARVQFRGGGARVVGGLRRSLESRAMFAVLGPASFCLAVVWGMIAYSLERVWQETVDDARIAVETSALLLEENARRTFAIIDQATRVVRSRYLAGGSASDLARLKSEILGDDPLFTQVSVLDSNGTLVASSTRLPAEPLNFADRSHFLAHFESQEDAVHVGNPLVERRSGRWTIHFSRRISGPAGEFAGVAVVSIDQYVLGAQLRAIALHSQGTVSMVGLDGVLRVHVDSEGIPLIGENLEQWQPQETARKKVRGWFKGVSSLDGITRYFAYRRIENYPIVVVTGMAEDSALSEYHRDRDRLLSLAAAVSLMILLSSIGGARVILQRERARVEAIRANEAKSAFLAAMSHEVRTPLNGVIGLAGLLLGSELTTWQREKTELIRKSGDILLSLLNDILDLSKIEAGKLDFEIVDFDVNELLQSMLVLWRLQAAEKGLQCLVITGELEERVLRGDPGRLGQILSNLVSNAIKFTESGGVKIRVFQARRDDGVLETCFEVADTGIGIAEEQRSLLFRKFTQLDTSTTRRYGGVGLGLAISRSLADRMGATIDFESSPGAGSRFCLRIPIPPGDAEAVRSARVPATVAAPTFVSVTAPESAPVFPAPTLTTSLRILVAEDNRINQLVIREMLEGAGHLVDVVADGEEAVDAVARSPYDLVLMDVHMPEMDGVTAARLIRELPGGKGHIPIIAVTADAMVGDREALLTKGMDDYVSKPVEAGALAAALARQCGSSPGVLPFRPDVADTPTDAKSEARLDEFVDDLDRATNR